MKKQNYDNGFTLIELLVSIAIIAVLIAALMPNFIGARQKAKDSQRIQELASVKNALRLYYNDNQKYPDCVDPGTCLNVVLKPYLVSINDVGYTYEQTGSGAAAGDGFILRVGLESNAGDEDVNSQVKCGIGTTEDGVFATCLY